MKEEENKKIRKQIEELNKIKLKRDREEEQIFRTSIS